MQPLNERRKNERRVAGDEMSPEVLALLVVCGGAVRQSDREPAPGEAGERRLGRRREDTASPP